jgi:hypothetical protein
MVCNIILDVAYREQDTRLSRMLSSWPLVLVTAANEDLHEKKQFIDKRLCGEMNDTIHPDHTARPWEKQKLQPSCQLI